MRMHFRRQRQSDKHNRGDNHISMGEASKILYLTDDGIRRYIQRGTIKGFKHGGKWWLNRDNVETLARAFKMTNKIKK